MISVATPRESFPAVIFYAAFVVAVAYWFVFSYGYVEDDAYIHLEFARSLAEGRGFAFNGRLTNGDTAPLWPLLLAAIHMLGFSWIASTKVLCVAGFASTVLATWYLATDLSIEGLRQPLLPVAALAVTVVNPYFVHWSFSGMESVTALGLSFWVIRAVFLGPPTPVRCICAALALALGPLFRPEFLLLDALAGPALLLRYWRSGAGQPIAHRMSTVALLAMIMVLPLAAWCVYAHATFGSVMPNTNLAKRGGPLRDLAPRLLSVYSLGFPVTLTVLPFAVLLCRRHWQARSAVTILFLWPLACSAFYLADHTLVQTRYCLLSMPSVSIGVLWLVATCRPAIFKATVLAMLLVSFCTIGWMVVPHVENKKDYSQVTSRASAFIREHIPAQDPVAVYAIGQIAFESRHPLVDTGGITRPSVIPYMTDPHAALGWAKSQGARYMITSELPEPQAERVFAATVPYLGWTIQGSLYQSRATYGIYRLP
jgi:hypothetical protein